MNTIEVMKQALEALERAHSEGLTVFEEIDALRAAIEAAESKGCKECDGTGYDYVGEVRVWCPICNNHNDTAKAEKAVPSELEPTWIHHQDWRGVDGATAFHLIDRHADDWADLGRMMNEWSRANPSPVPEGWQLVPVEPTREMLDAYVAQDGRFHSGKSDWKAMLAAAPKPEPKPEVK